jgi:hypothetical protein
VEITPTKAKEASDLYRGIYGISITDILDFLAIF